MDGMDASTGPLGPYDIASSELETMLAHADGLGVYVDLDRTTTVDTTVGTYYGTGGPYGTGRPRVDLWPDDVDNDATLAAVLAHELGHHEQHLEISWSELLKIAYAGGPGLLHLECDAWHRGARILGELGISWDADKAALVSYCLSSYLDTLSCLPDEYYLLTVGTLGGASWARR